MSAFSRPPVRARSKLSTTASIDVRLGREPRIPAVHKRKPTGCSVRNMPVRARRGESPQILNLMFVTGAANDGSAQSHRIKWL